MSREIKFRAWNKEEKTMGEPFLLEQAIRVRPQVDETKNCIYMQYTGLKDKNGKEIYEGDIVEYKRFNSISRKEVLFSEYNDGECYSDDKHLGWHTNEKTLIDISNYCEVIGNIYETPNQQ